MIQTFSSKDLQIAMLSPFRGEVLPHVQEQSLISFSKMGPTLLDRSSVQSCQAMCKTNGSLGVTRQRARSTQNVLQQESLLSKKQSNQNFSNYSHSPYGGGGGVQGVLDHRR